MSKDMQKLCVELTEQYRNMMLMKVCPEKSELLACMPDETERLKQLSASFELNEILSRLDILQECGEKISRSLNKRVEIEMCLIKLCSRQTLQKPLDNTVNYDKIKQVSSSNVTAVAPQQETEPVKPEADISKLKASDFKLLTEWSDILDELTAICPSVSGALSGSTAFVHKNIMLIDAKNKFFLGLFKSKDNYRQLEKAVQNVMGKTFVIRARCSASDKEEKKADALIEKAINSGIETAVE
jgi:DNA polymerase-3 subunit gamma/tau